MRAVRRREQERVGARSAESYRTGERTRSRNGRDAQGVFQRDAICRDAELFTSLTNLDLDPLCAVRRNFDEPVVGADLDLSELNAGDAQTTVQLQMRLCYSSPTRERQRCHTSPRPCSAVQRSRKAMSIISGLVASIARMSRRCLS